MEGLADDARPHHRGRSRRPSTVARNQKPRPRPGWDGESATPMGFEPTISTVTGWHVRPLHHGAERGAHRCGAPTLPILGGPLRPCQRDWTGPLTPRYTRPRGEP